MKKRERMWAGDVADRPELQAQTGKRGPAALSPDDSGRHEFIRCISSGRLS